MNRQRIARELVALARGLTGALTSGLWAYQTKMWESVTKDLSKALASAFGRYANVDFAHGDSTSAYVTLKGTTRSDFTLKVTVHVIGMGNNQYSLIVSAERPDWGKYQHTFIEEKKSFSDFDPRAIAKRAAEGAL